MVSAYVRYRLLESIESDHLADCRLDMWQWILKFDGVCLLALLVLNLQKVPVAHGMKYLIGRRTY